MSDLKSKLPDFKEVTSIAAKLFKDVKTSVSEIIIEYKKKRAEEAAAAEAEAAKTPKVSPQTDEIVEEKPKAPAPKKAKEKTTEKAQEKPENAEKQD